VQEDDGLCKTNTEFVVDHGVAAVLDHDGTAVEAGEPGQRLDEVGGLVHGLGLFVVVCGCRGSRDHVCACSSSGVWGAAKLCAASAALTLTLRAGTPSPPRPVASAAPLAGHSTVSFVPVSGANPSAATACARCRHWSSVRSASVVSRHRAVLTEGSGPLAIPPTVTPPSRWKAILATVSLVRKASAAANPPPRPASPSAVVTPCRDATVLGRVPVGPTAHRAISWAEPASSSAVCSARTCTSWKPESPVPELAAAESSTTARRRPSEMTCSDHRTGAAGSSFSVNTPPAVRDGPSLTTTAMSR